MVQSETFQYQSSEDTVHEILIEIYNLSLIPVLHKPWLVCLSLDSVNQNKLSKHCLELVSVACNQRIPTDAKIGNHNTVLHVMLSNKLLVEWMWVEDN